MTDQYTTAQQEQIAIKDVKDKIIELLFVINQARVMGLTVGFDIRPDDAGKMILKDITVQKSVL